MFPVATVVAGTSQIAVGGVGCADLWFSFSLAGSALNVH